MAETQAHNPVAQSPFAGCSGISDAARRTGGVRLEDLSALPRNGFKGKGTSGWLAQQAGNMPQEPNQAVMLGDGTTLAWLGGEEYLLLSGATGGGGLAGRIDQDWAADRAKGVQGIGFPLPRADTHSWLRVSGANTPEMMAKICGVDLRPECFAEGAVAQTVAARIGVILIRADWEGEYGLHMLSDCASAGYLWAVLQDAADEYNGGVS